jgi:outer membrane protein
MIRNTILWVAVVWAVTFPAAHAAGLEIAAGGWRHSPEGQISYEAVGPGDIIDIEDDLDYDTETQITGRLKVDMPVFLPNLYIVAAPMEFEGTGRKSVDFRFGDEVFAANADLDSKVTLDQYDIGLYYGIPGVRTASAGFFNIEVGLNARIVDLSARIRAASASDPATIVEEEESFTVVVPMLYLAVQMMPTDSFALELEGRGLAIADDSLYSFTGRLRYNIFGPAFIAGGYRFDSIDIDEDDVTVDADFHGPFAEVGLKF